MDEKHRETVVDARPYSPRIIRLWGVVAIIAASVAASIVALRAVVGRRDQWILGDWLIDYSAGFSRRGLVGEFVRQVDIALGVDRILLIGIIQLLTLGALAVFLLILVSHHNRGLTTILLVTSPAFVLFFLDPLGTMRKEIVLWAMVAGVLAWSQSRPNTAARLLPWVVAAAFPLLVLIHEALVLYAGFVVIMMVLLVQEGTVSKVTAWRAGSVGIAGTLVAAGASVFWPGQEGRGQEICNNLVNSGYSEVLCSGSILFLDQDVVFSLGRVANAVMAGNYLGVYLSVLILSLVPFFFVRWSTPMAWGIVVSVLMTLPLFVVAIDWGRWIVISVWLVTLLVLRFDGSRHITVVPINTPRSRVLSVLFPVGVIAYATLWSVPHCCETRIGFGVVDRVADALMVLGF